jgi:NhaA family Na+:H+ antiporter
MLGIVPLFGFVSAGVAIDSLAAALAPLPLGIALGLFLGKQAGVFGAVWLADRLGLARKPASLSWAHVYAASLLCGIGFTMSLFIGALAFGRAELVEAAKIGTLLGSAASMVAAFVVFKLAGGVTDADVDRSEADEVFGQNFPDEPGLDQERSG